jgi:hypothetical protein
MPRMLLALLMLGTWVPAGAAPADESRLSYLEQEVRSLRRELQALSRQIEAIQRQDRVPSAPGVPAAIIPSASEQDLAAPVWVDAARWQRVHLGDGEMDVIKLLGPPTSTREEDDARVLFYALQIGSSGFLGGSVTLRNHVVTRVRVPTLQ